MVKQVDSYSDPSTRLAVLRKENGTSPGQAIVFSLMRLEMS
jgi:hypothetical protein